MKIRNVVGFFVFGALMLILSSCAKEEIRKTFPLSADIFHSIADDQVAFTALTHSAVNWLWDFGDGETSTEQNPVHIYADGGYYKIVLTATGSDGNVVSNEIDIAVNVTPYVLLTGGATAVNGKTWKLSPNQSPHDKFANADADLSTVDGTPEPLPQGVFDLLLGMGEVYEDEYTFYFDGNYSLDPKSDNAVFGGIVYQFATTGGAGIVNPNGQDFGLCTGLYTPDAEATFTYVPSEDFNVPSVYGPGGVVTYSDVSTLDFTGTSFVGFKDFQSKVILQDISDKTMRLVMFMSASIDFAPLNTNALILTFDAVD